MTSKVTQDDLCIVIEQALKNATDNAELSESITIESKMGSPLEWDSLSFVSVFLAVSEHFNVELDDDDAILFRDARSIHKLLNEIV